MKYVKWEVIPGTYLPMMEDRQGELFGTNKTVRDGLGLTEESIWKIYNRHKNEFGSFSLSNCPAKEFFKVNKALFDMKRVRDDIRLWNEDDMLTFAFYAQSDKGLEFRRNLRMFIKENAKRHYVNQADYDLLKADFKALTEFVLRHVPAVNETASLAGRSLAAHKKTKEIRGYIL